jgi:hypothetical protein
LFEKNGWQVIDNMFGRPMTFDELKERVGDIDAVVAGVERSCFSARAEAEDHFPIRCGGRQY